LFVEILDEAVLFFSHRYYTLLYNKAHPFIRYDI
jgi:hypothetical protein